MEFDRYEALRHREVVDAIQKLLAISEGRILIKYLLDSFGVNELPELGLEGNFLHDRLGFLRAGQSLFKIISEADHIEAGRLVAEIERERRNEDREDRYDTSDRV